MAASRAARDLDVVLYGASGFTGRLVARWLAAHPGARVGLAGRSAERLREARDEVAAAASASWDPPLIACDAADEAALRALAERTRVVVSTAGPFSLCGTPLVGACAAAGTDYLDINGEVPWVREVVERYDAAAAERGTLIVPNCGCARSLLLAPKLLWRHSSPHDFIPLAAQLLCAR